MKKINKQRKPRKEIKTPLLVILTLMLAPLLLGFGICLGFLINSIINASFEDVLAGIIITLPVFIVYFILLTILMCNSDSENVQPLKWYINNHLISLVVCLVIAGVTVFSLGVDNDIDINYVIGFLTFPFVGVISTPNIVKHVFNNSKWKEVLYKHGNLHKAKNNNDFYRLATPVPFEDKLKARMRLEEFLNVLVVVVIMLIIILVTGHYMVTDHSYTDDLLKNIMIMRARKAFGFMFFLTIFLLAFGIPIIAYYISNAIYRFKIIKEHKYLAYHAIVSGGSNGIAIYQKNMHYQFKYCIYIGIKAKDVHQTPATLIFIPDYVLVVPDSEEYKLDKYKYTK